MSTHPRLSPHSLERHHLVLKTCYHVHHQAPCPKSCRRHLLLWATRKNDHPLHLLLHDLLTCTFLRHVFKTRRRSTHTNTSLSNLTDSKFGTLLLKAKAHLLSNFPCTSTSSANPQSSRQSPLSKDTPHTRPSFPPPTPGKQPFPTFPCYTSVAMQATHPQSLIFCLGIWYTLFDPPFVRHS
jgi:hypothetical protein